MTRDPGQRGCMQALGWVHNGPVIFPFGKECLTSPSGQQHFIGETDLAKDTALHGKINLLFLVASTS